MRNASPSPTPAATTAPISENAGAPSRSANSGVSFPPTRTKNVHVGLHLATGSRAHGPTADAASPGKWEHRCEEIIAPWANAPFAIVEQSPQCNFDQRRMASDSPGCGGHHRRGSDASTSSGSPFFGRGCPDGTVVGVDRVGKLTTSIFGRSYPRSALDHDVYGV